MFTNTYAFESEHHDVRMLVFFLMLDVLVTAELILEWIMYFSPSTASRLEKVFHDPYGRKHRLLQSTFSSCVSLLIFTNAYAFESGNYDVSMLVFFLVCDVLVTAVLILEWVMYFTRPGKIGGDTELV